MKPKRKLIRPAQGLVACLMYCSDGKYRIRVYHEHKLSMFDDYEINISDMFFEITDEFACLYEDENTGIKYIDYDPATLGHDVYSPYNTSNS